MTVSSELRDALCTEDLWRRMRKRVPPIVSEYFVGGADEEITLKGNVKAFQQTVLNVRGATRFETLDTSTTVLGHELAVPWYISPVGSLRTIYPKGDAVAARVAGNFGTVMGLSTLSGTRMEEVAAASSKQCWFQLYLCGGRDTALRAINRAKKAGFTALFLTIDTGVSGQRRVHERMKPLQALHPWEGLSGNERLQWILRRLQLAPQMSTRLPWLTDLLGDEGVMRFVNIIDDKGEPMPFTDIGSQLASSAVTWADFEWIREAWGRDRPIIIKGVHCADDAKRAEDVGANAVVWSNHGGRQMDRVPPTLHMVQSEMPKLSGSRLTFLMDGGIRCGTDILIALSHGIQAVGIGRAMVAGLGAGGEAGLTRSFEILREGLERGMRLTGVGSVDEIRSMGADLRCECLLQGDSHLPPFVY
ncbi:alpha-hydroxy acid oxidase [Synechococcus sp. MIT S9504]|uniref:alpha-hydroxy acid oxidase n=1 Tax=Synechococcus sp. MIT S9504 TaxID=1801628 RepID=UPI0007BB6053|nr:alpha-hydroxy acid oxidase [Synechococcus sp. MIT S9504]KZR85863.1 L-lactate dehydrogenase [cytochrome] [Synechococcus sp. MIT S9504]